MSFIKGAMMVLAFIVLNVLIALITNTGDTTNASSNCDTVDGVTTCEGESSVDLLIQIITISFTGIPGAVWWFNVIYVAAGGYLLVVGVVEMIRSFVPLLNGG